MAMVPTRPARPTSGETPLPIALMRGVRFRCVVAVFLPGLLACGGHGSGGPATVVHDSAGVHVVESVRAAWSRGEGWRVAREPTVRIGVIDGDPAYQFDGIRNVRLLEEGGFAVLDGGSRQLRRYDADGRHLWSAGGPGRGPGQFEAPNLVGRAGDGSFVVWDRSLSRETVIAATGDSIDTEPPPSAVNGEVPIVHARFDDGAWLATYPRVIAPPAMGTVLADTLGLWRVDPLSLERRLLVHLPGPLWVFLGRGQLPVPFTANPLRAIAGTRLYTASGPSPEVRVLDEDGRPLARYTLPTAPALVTAAAVRGFIDSMVALKAYGASARVWDEWLDRMPVPDTAPAFDRLMLDDAGNIWVRRFLLDPASPTTPAWDVLDAGGAWLGTLTTPAGLEVFSVAGGLLAGVARDSLDVEHVEIHRIDTSRTVRRDHRP